VVPAPDPAAPADLLREAEQALADEPEHDRTVFLARLRRHWPDLLTGLQAVYGDEAEETARCAVERAVAAFQARPADLRLLDLRRHVEPDWFQAPSMLGYAAYADRFAGDLRGVAERVPYLAELGVTYLHLLPLLQPRPGPDDGGYAVMDYRAVRRDLGTVEDLSALAAVLRRHGISLVLDLVLNHVAAEHDWAQRARAGEERYRRYFHLFPDRTEPDAFERTLPEVFPDFAPGSFTWDDDAHAWVWTTFNAWQWDLNWHEPACSSSSSSSSCSSPTRGSRCSGSTRSPSCGSGWAPTARTSRRCTRSPRRCAPSPGASRPSCCSRQRRSSVRSSSCPTSGPACTRAR
jgi:amylosucrase